MRITRRHLDSLVKRLNKEAGAPITSYAWDEQGQWKACVGNFHIEHGAIGYTVLRITSPTGAVVDALGVGARPAREIYAALSAFLNGMYFARGK